ncbi:MAG: tetratricopeptide repeat protein [Parvularcula sp.]|nr:tetratricopeptide repeat protein [Parvularcula sp.]
MTAWRVVKALGVGALSSTAALTAQAWADYENALNAYLDARTSDAVGSAVTGALDLWQRSALAGDVRSAKILGDVYSDQDLLPGNDDLLPSETGAVRINAVEALAWYTIAATHNFGDYQQRDPLPEAVNARTLAQLRLPELKARMTDEDVRAGERRVIELLGVGSAFDLLRLGKMHMQGNGLPKDNIEALKYLYVARGRGRGANAGAEFLIGDLEPLLTRTEIDAAAMRADNWQPPMPQTYLPAHLTEGARKDAVRLTELQYQELRDALEKLDKQFDGNGRVVQKALRALGFYWDDDIDGKLTSRASQDAIRRFQTSLFIDGRAPSLRGTDLSDEEKALVRDTATGTLTDLQLVELVRRAAERGHPDSMHIYGVMLGEGIGVRKNGREAIQMLVRSAEQGYALAHYSAGIFYVEGITAPEPLQPSVSEACYHLSRAANMSYEPADKALKLHCNYD